MLFLLLPLLLLPRQPQGRREVSILAQAQPSAISDRLVQPRGWWWTDYADARGQEGQKQSGLDGRLLWQS